MSEGPTRAYFYTPAGDLIGFDPNRPARQRALHYRIESEFRKLAYQAMDPTTNKIISNMLAIPTNPLFQADVSIHTYLAHTPLWRDLDDPRRSTQR